MLFHMGVVADMINAVAMIALTLGAVAELQFRMLCIRAAADGAAVIVGCLGLGYTGLIRACGGEGDDLGLFGRVALLLFE